jgi:hypothetical protein
VDRNQQAEESADQGEIRSLNAHEQTKPKLASFLDRTFTCINFDIALGMGVPGCFRMAFLKSWLDLEQKQETSSFLLHDIMRV